MLVSILIGFLTLIIWKIIEFYVRVLKYPAGPLPVPFVGNLITFIRNLPIPFDYTIDSFAEKYGSVFTIWIGHQPIVCIMDQELATTVLKDKDFAGRPPILFSETFKSHPSSVDIVFGDIGRGWEVNRKICFSALRKYISNPILPGDVVSAVDQVLSKNENSRKLPMPHVIHDIMLLAISTAVSGDRYRLEDEEFLRLKEAFSTLATSSNPIFFVGEVHPWVEKIIKAIFFPKALMQSSDYFKRHIGLKHDTHEKSFTEGPYEGRNRDFTDALLSSKMEVERTGCPTDLKHLSKWSLVNDMMLIFFGGVQTTTATLSWWFLCLGVFKEWQKRIRQEVESVLEPDDIPTLDLRKKCPLTQAFTMEVLRMFPAVKMSIPHKAVEEKVVAGHRIWKGTPIIMPLSNKSEKVWGADAHQFRPERFLEKSRQDGSVAFVSRPNLRGAPAILLTFGGVGARSCIGERLALANIFLITTRILQRTRGKMLEVLSNGQRADNSQFDLEQLFKPDVSVNFYTPNPYTLSMR